MFGDLPKLFGRDFAIAFYLPVVAALVVGFLLTQWYRPRDPPSASAAALQGPSHDSAEGVEARASLAGDSAAPPPAREVEERPPLDRWEFLLNHPILSASALGFASWLGAVVLLALNYPLIRFKEGYGRLNPLRLLIGIQEGRLQRLRAERDRLREPYKAYLEEPSSYPDFDPAGYARIQQRLSTEFPDRKQWLLPTAFGNAIRAFEVYPRVLYGLDAIPAWSRIRLIMTKDHLDLVDAAKAQMDFWLNCWLLSLFLLAEYAYLVTRSGALGPWLFPPICALLVYLSSVAAKGAAIRWGESVKAGFDVYVPELRKRLTLEPVSNLEEERKQWAKLSQAMIYRSADALPPRKNERPEEPSEQDE